MPYFLEPIIDSLNYVQNNSVAGGFPTYTEFDMVGLSGGGWSTVLIAALDTRIKTSIQVGGSQPLDLWTASDVAEAGANYGGLPDEQTDHKLYNVAAYRDLYLLGAAGPGRKQIQVLNLYDSCCFNPAWAGFSGGAPGAIWDSWHAVVHAYEADVNAALYNIGDPGNFRVEIDEASIQHQISRNSLGNIILPELEGARRHVGASDSSDAFVRAMSGTMWHWSFGLGWEDTQLQIVGVPAVIINGQHPMDVIYRDPLNQIRDAYQVNLFGVTTWTSQAIGGACRSNQSEPIEGGTIVSDPAAVSWGPGRVDVLAFCPDNTLGHWFFGGANWGFDNPVPWVTGVGTPSITSMAAGTLDGTFRDMAGGASMASYSGGWGSRSLGGTIIGLPSVTATSSSLIRVYALGHDNQLYEAYRNTGSWSAWSSLSSATGSTAKLAGTPSAWGSAFGLTVYVPGTDGILKVFSLDQMWRFTNSGLVLYGSPTAVSTGAFADEVVYNNDLDFYNGASVFLGGRIQ